MVADSGDGLTGKSERFACVPHRGGRRSPAGGAQVEAVAVAAGLADEEATDCCVVCGRVGSKALRGRIASPAASERRLTGDGDRCSSSTVRAVDSGDEELEP